jgi:hypothetical protein
MELNECGCRGKRVDRTNGETIAGCCNKHGCRAECGCGIRDFPCG